MKLRNLFLNKLGCSHVYLLSDDWCSQILAVSENNGVTAVYDSIGIDVFSHSLKCLMPMGIYISYGESSGKIPYIDTEVLAAKSLFFTKPSIFHYKGNRMELILSADEVFKKIHEGSIHIEYTELKMEEASVAHSMIEAFDHNKAIILRP